MSDTDFGHQLSSVSTLSPEQMRQLSRELEIKLEEAESSQPSLDQDLWGAMRDAADDLDEAVEYAMQLRQRPWRLPDGE